MLKFYGMYDIISFLLNSDEILTDREWDVVREEASRLEETNDYLERNSNP